jgi:hypothetical protein
MIAHEFINYELEFDLKNPHKPTEDESTGILDERDDAIDNECIKEVGMLTMFKLAMW